MPNNSEEVINSAKKDNDVLYMEAGFDLKNVVEKMLLNFELDGLQNSVTQDSIPYLHIDPSCIELGVTPISVIQPTATVIMKTSCRQFPPSSSQTYFLIRTNNYLLVFSRKGNTYLLRRNNINVSLEVPPTHETGVEEITIGLVWGLNEIGITGFLSSPEIGNSKPRWTATKRDWKKTVSTRPPNVLYSWARKQLLLPSRPYESSGEVFNKVLSAFLILNEEISITNDTGGFWDEQKCNRELAPKHETIITRHIQSRLRDFALQNNIDIMREVELGNSKLDLLFSAPVENNQTVKICIEIKKAHAQNLARGLTNQLPEYMRREGTDYGIYCVIYFGEDFPPNLKSFNEPSIEKGMKANVDKLGFVLMAASSKLPFTNIIPIIIDVSPKLPASRI